MDVNIGVKSIPGGGATSGNCKKSSDVDRGPGAVAAAVFFLARRERPLGEGSPCLDSSSTEVWQALALLEWQPTLSHDAVAPPRPR